MIVRIVIEILLAQVITFRSHIKVTPSKSLTFRIELMFHLFE